MAFTPAETLKNRTFVGLIVAQFLAGFNDQAIHASAMFYAIHQGILSEARAISLMPILFYAPWAIFSTVSGYFADRYSKTYTLVIWKYSEILIALVALTGFILSGHVGGWIVLSTVFMMGTHAAFFAPAKYGAMPEILQPHILSRGNGILESTTFLAAILGTVTGGLLSFAFHGQEYWIGVVLLALSVTGAVASMMIAYLPPANPTRLFPKNLFKPLFDNLVILFRSRPLALAVVGIAFFVFMVAYMRQCMYMHGETRVPRWDEFKTSLVVASVALGVGLGSPLAGYLSGGKIELGLVPLGCMGMIFATLLAALTIHETLGLILCLIVIGFFSGFYMVPLYTLLQHRAPTTTRGDMVATSNFINVVGAMAASVLFFILVNLGQITGITPVIEQKVVFVGGLAERFQSEKSKKWIEPISYDQHGRPAQIRLNATPQLAVFMTGTAVSPAGAMPLDAIAGLYVRPRVLELGLRKRFQAKSSKSEVNNEEGPEVVIEPFEEGFFEVLGGSYQPGDMVVVTSYELHNVPHYRIRPAGQPLGNVYDNDRLPRFLFIGAALMTMGILVLLCRRLPDFLVRTIYWFRCLGRVRVRAVGMDNLPTSGAVILATNCLNLESTLQLLVVTDRYTIFVVPGPHPPTTSVFHLVEPGSLIALASAEALPPVQGKIRAALGRGNLVALSIEQGHDASSQLFNELRRDTSIPVVPVFCGPIDPNRDANLPEKIRVVFGEVVANGASLDEIRHGIHQLGDWIQKNDDHVYSGGH